MIPRGRLKRHARLVRRSKAVRRQPWSHLGDRHAHVRELDRNWGSQLLTGGARREKKGSLTPLITEVDWSPPMWREDGTLGLTRNAWRCRHHRRHKYQNTTWCTWPRYYTTNPCHSRWTLRISEVRLRDTKRGRGSLDMCAWL